MSAAIVETLQRRFIFIDYARQDCVHRSQHCSRCQLFTGIPCLSPTCAPLQETIGIMLPTSSGGGLAVIGALMTGRTPVMIDYSTGTEKTCAYAQGQCDFLVIVAARAPLEKTDCKQLPEMIFIELSNSKKAAKAIKHWLPSYMASHGQELLVLDATRPQHNYCA